MMADKYKIIEEATTGVFDEHELDITGLSVGIDEYIRLTCLELLEYVWKNSYRMAKGNVGFVTPIGEILSKEQVFENFL